MHDKTRYFSDKDRRLLEATSKSTWTPEDPRSLLAPFVNQEDETEETDLEKRYRKSQEVLGGYQRLEAKCKETLNEITTRCKDVSIPIDKKKDKAVLDAARRVFKRDVEEITFEMYTQLVHAMAQDGNNVVPDSAKGKRLV